MVIVKPQTYMNLSGIALRPLLADAAFDAARDLLVLVDDADLPLGTFRLRAQGSAGGHNGLRSVEDALRSRVYSRLRIGVGPVPPGLDDLADFVLAPFEPTEVDVLTARLPLMMEAVECWVTDGIEETMQRFNHLGNHSE